MKNPVIAIALLVIAIALAWWGWAKMKPYMMAGQGAPITAPTQGQTTAPI